MPKHWSEIMQCSCGQRFSSPLAEAHHRHNFPILCRRPNPTKAVYYDGKRKWTDELDAALMKLWQEGFTTNDICVKMQKLCSWPISRNSIIGRVHRLMKTRTDLAPRPNPVLRDDK